MMMSRSCGGVARAGPRRAISDPSLCRSTKHSTSSPPRASSGSVLNLQSVTKYANSSLGSEALEIFSNDSVPNQNHSADLRDCHCVIGHAFEQQGRLGPALDRF